jgi:hypothetical protein
MRQLTLECGYSSAALRERLYIDGGDQKLAGLLIYTSTSDADGTLGGLQRQDTSDLRELTAELKGLINRVVDSRVETRTPWWEHLFQLFVALGRAPPIVEQLAPTITLPPREEAFPRTELNGLPPWLKVYTSSVLNGFLKSLAFA